MIEAEKIIYVAGPYSHSDRRKEHERFCMLSEYAGHLMQQGHIVFSPISHGHPIAERVDLPRDYNYWRRHCEAFLRRCNVLHVLKLPGWSASVGVAAERDLATELLMPIKYIEMDYARLS